MKAGIRGTQSRRVVGTGECAAQAAEVEHVSEAAIDPLLIESDHRWQAGAQSGQALLVSQFVQRVELSVNRYAGARIAIREAEITDADLRAEQSSSRQDGAWLMGVAAHFMELVASSHVDANGRR